ncbi:MAG: hypothetical protein IJ563_03890 [Selenomonadaceae bacterium]|nr:hypothetical protein [Selenomonadaceae bacterium]
MAFDFGWWYLNLSRLQNAADSAALAGAHQIAKDESSGYFVNLVNEDLTGWTEVNDNEPGDSRKYANNNLSGSDTNSQDSWTANNVTFKHYLIAGVSVDAEEEAAGDTDDNVTYYKVELTETVNHLFTLMEQFGAMDIKATAIVKITKGFNSNGLPGDLRKLKEAKVIPDWEYVGQSIANLRTVRAVGRMVNYSSGDTYRTEIINLNGIKGADSGDANTMNTTGDWSVRANQTEIKNNKYKIDDIFIDFRADLNYNFTSDWDIGLNDDLIKKVKYAYQNSTSPGQSWQDGAGYDLRIIAEINFDKPYKVRSGKDTSGNIVKDSSGKELLPTDPLYVRIESDPIYTVRSVNSSVRQVVININEPNTETNADGSYKYRPLIIFYDGPIQLDPTSNIRKSKPVILNLNADFRGILFMPNSSVVINGNATEKTEETDKFDGYKFEGFVIAKDFVKLKTADDLTSEGYVAYKTANDAEILLKPNDYSDDDILSAVPSGKIEVTDSDGNSLFVNESDLIYVDDYDIDTYIHVKSGQEAYVYIKNNATIETDYNKYHGKSNWYELYKKDNHNEYGYVYLSGTNLLLYKDGWRINADDSENKFFYNTKDKNYIPVKYNGKTATLKKNDDTKIYIKITNTTDVKYIKKDSEVEYLTKVTQTKKLYDKSDDNNWKIIGEISGLNPMYVDKKGNVQFTSPIEPHTSNLDYDPNKMYPEDKTILSPDDFNLSTDSHYAYFGIPALERKFYTYLNEEVTKDMFFTIDRSNLIDKKKQIS